MVCCVLQRLEGIRFSRADSSIAEAGSERTDFGLEKGCVLWCRSGKGDCAKLRLACELDIEVNIREAVNLVSHDARFHLRLEVSFPLQKSFQILLRVGDIDRGISSARRILSNLK